MFLKYNLIAIIWSIVILILTMVTGVRDSNLGSSFSDKMVHAFMFGVLSLLLIIGFTKQNSNNYIKYNAEKIAVWTCIIFGLSIEIVQYLLPYRSFSWNDVLSNIVGSFLGLGMFYLIYKLKTT